MACWFVQVDDNIEEDRGLSTGIFFKKFYVCFLLEKLINKKHFTVKEKFNLIFRKIFYFLDEKHFLEVVKNFKVFDFIKFDLQTFDCYIFCFESFFFQFQLLEFDFYINFSLYFFNYFFSLIFF